MKCMPPTWMHASILRSLVFLISFIHDQCYTALRLRERKRTYITRGRSNFSPGKLSYLKKAIAYNADVCTGLLLSPTAWISTPNTAFEPQLDCAQVLLLKFWSFLVERMRNGLFSYFCTDQHKHCAVYRLNTTHRHQVTQCRLHHHCNTTRAAHNQPCS